MTITDINGKVVAAGARVVVTKYGRLRVGTVRWTKKMVTTGEVYVRAHTTQRVCVDLDPKDATVRTYRRRYNENTWEGSGEKLVVVAEAPNG